MLITYRKFLEFKAKAVNAATHQDSVVRLGYELHYGALAKFKGQLGYRTPHQLILELQSLGFADQKIINAVGMSAIAYLEDVHQYMEYAQQQLLTGE